MFIVARGNPRPLALINDSFANADKTTALSPSQ